MNKRVAVVSPPVPFLWCPHSRICLSGAVRQRRITGVIFPKRVAPVVFCLVTLGENKGLLLWTWQGTWDISVLGSESFLRQGIVGVTCVYDGERTYSSCYPWFLSRGQGCTGRTRLCFCVSSSTPFPPNLYSVCDSWSHSLTDRKNVETLTEALILKGSVHSNYKRSGDSMLCALQTK